MSAPANPDLDALNSLLHALNDLRVYLHLVSEHLAALQRSSSSYDLILAIGGEFRGATYRHNPTETQLAGHPDLLDLESHIEWLPKYIDGLWKTVPEVDKALFELPKRLVKTLSWLTDSPWDAHLRRHCLDQILAWPGESLHQTSWGAEKLSGDINELLQKAEKFDPFPAWSTFYNLIGDYTKDLFAIRGEVVPQSASGSVVSPASVVPSDPITDRDDLDIIALLKRVGHRLTLPQMIAEFDADNNVKAESTIKPKLARMVAGHRLTNRQDTRPHKGYGLPEWV